MGGVSFAFIKPRGYEYELHAHHKIVEMKFEAVATEKCPTHRFVKNGTAVGKFKIATAGDRVIGVRTEFVNPNGSDYDDIATGDLAPVLLHSTAPVVVEAGAGVTADALAEAAIMKSDADGKAVAVTSGAYPAMWALEAFTPQNSTTVYVRGFLLKSTVVSA